MALDLSGLTQDQQIAAAAAYAGVPESVVRGQWRVESGNGRAQKNAQGIIVSSAGARGDFQVMPQTQATIEARTGKKYDVRNFQDNLEMYAHIMRENMQMAKGDVTTALRIYHGGTNRANWGKNNAAYAPAVLGNAAVSSPATPITGGGIGLGGVGDAWRGAGNMTTHTWSGASIPAAWRGDPIGDGSGNSLSRATKDYIGKVREGLGELAMGQVAGAGGDVGTAVDAAEAVRGSDEVVPWWVRQTIPTLDTKSNDRNRQIAIAETKSDRDEAAFRDSLTFLDKWGAAFDYGLGAALANQLARDREVAPEGWVYDPKVWEKPHYTADELEDIRDAAWSPDELSYATDRINTRRYSMRVKENQSGWGSLGYDLVAGLTDPGNWLVGGATGLAAGGLRVGGRTVIAGMGSSAEAFAAGQVGRGLGYAAAENAAASVAIDALLVGLGERRTLGNFLTDAAFSVGIGTAMRVPGARSAAALRDQAQIDLTTSNAAMYGESWNNDLRARAVAEVGEDNPVALNARVHSLAREEVMDWIRAGMADVPDDFRLFARPDVAQEAPTNSGATGQMARDSENVVTGVDSVRGRSGGDSIEVLPESMDFDDLITRMTGGLSVSPRAGSLIDSLASKYDGEVQVSAVIRDNPAIFSELAKELDLSSIGYNAREYARVGQVVEWGAPADPLLTRAWKASGIKGTPDDILRYLESSKNVPEDYRAIANALKRSGRLNGVRIAPDSELDQWFPNQSDVAGGYNPSLNAMALRSNAHNAEVVLHEVLHAGTFRALRTDANFKSQMGVLLKHVNSNLTEADRALMTRAMRGRVDQSRAGFLANSDELISYGMTNRDVQAVLRNISAPPGSPQKTAWEWLKDKIARVLGLSDQESALERLMTIVGQNLGEEIRSPKAASEQTRGMLANSIFKTNRERKAFYARTGLDKQISDDATRIQVAEVVARAERFSGRYDIDATKLTTIMQKVGLEATSTTLMSSQSPVARMVAVTLLENPEGAAGRHTTAAMDRRGRFESFMGSRPRQWEAAYRLWRADVRKAGPVRDFVTGWKMRSDFEYEVKLYREQTYMGMPPPFDTHPSIVQMAKSLDEGYNRMAAEQRAVGTVGSSRLPTDDVSGYETRTWLGGKIAAASRTRREGIRQALKEQFDGIGALYGDEFLEKFSIKYLERIEERAAGMHRRPDNLFSDDKSDTLRDTLRALSMNEEDIAKVMGRYSRGGAKHTKSRIDLDVTQKYKDAEGEFRLMDYLDNRVMENYRKYAGRVAGDVALAKHGIMGDAGVGVLRKAMQTTGATDVELRAFDQVMSEFTGRVVGTGDPTVLANARLLTSAIQLGGAGINQAAEYSNGLTAVGAAGVAEAIRIAPRMRSEITRMLRGQDPENSILSGFEFISGRGFGLAGYDLHMFNSLDTQASLYGSERAGFMTALSQRTANANRILSGQRAVLAVQQRGFAEVLIAKGVKFLRDGTAADTALKDMGIDDVLLDRLRRTQNQVVRWGSDGKLEAVDPRALDNLQDRQAWLAFYNAIDRGTSQILQDTFIGETGKWAHNGWLKLLFQHRTFSLVAQQKQLGRYVGLYGAWGTAGIIASAMAVVAPLQVLRMASRAVLLPDEQREQAFDEALSPLTLGRSTMNYISSTGFLGDVLEVGTGVAGGWYEHASDTGSPDWVRKLAGGQLGSRKEIIGGNLAPALGVVNDFAQGISGRPENLADVLPGGRLPYVIPLLKGAAAHMEE